MNKVLRVALTAAAVILIIPGQAFGRQDIPGEMIDIGGYQVHVVCEGEGDQTVLLDAGAGAWSFMGLPVQMLLAQSGFKTCTWDRPGLGLSDPGPDPRTSETIVGEMKAMVLAAGLKTPLVMVGHSFGGQNVRMFAATYPELVKGVILVDSGHEHQWERFPAVVWQAVEAQIAGMNNLAQAIRGGAPAPPSPPLPDHLPSEWKEAFTRVNSSDSYYDGVAREFAGIPESNKQLAQSGSLDDLPVLILTAERSFYAFEGMFDIDIEESNNIWLELQRDLIKLSTKAEQIVIPEATHRLLETHTELVSERIVEFIRSLARSQGGGGSNGEWSRSGFDALLHRMEDAYNSKDSDAFTDLFTEDVVVRDVNRRQLVEGRKAWHELTVRVMSAHHWMKLEAIPFSVSGSTASVSLRWSGLLKGEAMGREDDVSYSYEGVSLMSVNDGKIADHRLFIDYASFRDQIGDLDRVRRGHTIEASWQTYTDAWRRGDLDDILSFFEEDAQLVSAGAGEFEGKAPFRTWLKESYDESTSVVLESDELILYDTEAVRRGRYRIESKITNADSSPLQTGYFMQVWHLSEDGRWRIKRGIFN